MEPESSLPQSQVPAICPYPEPARSSQHHHFPLSEDEADVQEIINNMKNAVLLNVAHSCLLERYQHFWKTYFLHLLGGSTFLRDVFEIPTTRRHNPEDSNLQSHCLEKIKSYIIMLGFYYDL